MERFWGIPVRSVGSGLQENSFTYGKKEKKSAQVEREKSVEGNNLKPSLPDLLESKSFLQTMSKE